ncbi:MAG: hypothetical protein ACOX7A_08745 [Lawsonibacter sp.]|jgi:hypothetical protein
MKLQVGQFGFRLLLFVGYCGEVPISLVRWMEGYYDYNRRVVTELVRAGYLKERIFRAEQRHVVRSLSLTEAGLRQIQHLSPNQAAQIRQHLLAPKDGQGNWRRTHRLHRNAACLLAAIKLGAVWMPGKSQDAARGKKLVYYSTYHLDKKSGKDNKSARASGIFADEYTYYPAYYLGDRNMRWNTETEQLLRDRFELSEIGRNLHFGGNLLLGDDWALAERIVRHAKSPHSRLIRFTPSNTFYYGTLDRHGIMLLQAILDGYYSFQLQNWLYERCGCPVTMLPGYLFQLDGIGKPDLNGEESNYFFDFQFSTAKKICPPDANLTSMPSGLLEDFDTAIRTGEDAIWPLHGRWF